MILYDYVPFRNGNFSQRKEFAPRGSEFFPFCVLPNSMEITFTTLSDLLECYYLYTHMRKLPNGSYANVLYNLATACDFQQCGILTSVDSYKHVHSP